MEGFKSVACAAVGACARARRIRVLAISTIQFRFTHVLRGQPRNSASSVTTSAGAAEWGSATRVRYQSAARPTNRGHKWSAPVARGGVPSVCDPMRSGRGRNLESRAKIVARWIRSLSLNPLPMGEGKKASRHVMQGSLFREWGKNALRRFCGGLLCGRGDIGGSLRLTGRIAYSRASDPILLLGCCQGFYAADSG